MNKEIAQKWVDALRSGDYKQGRGWLRQNDGYCCLGVLCDLAAKENIGKWDGDSFDPLPGCNDWSGKRESPAVRDWSSLDVEFAAGLAQNNDSGASFDEIASMIEKEAGLVA